MFQEKPHGRKYVIAVPFRTDYYSNYARILERAGMLRKALLWTRYGFADVDDARQDLLPILGLCAYAASISLPPYLGESFRFALHPLFDSWARTKIIPGDHVISSYGYANSCFRWARKNGGTTFLDGGNSHPAYSWKLLSEEHKRWGCSYPPVAKFHYHRSLAMMDDVDYILSPSNFVANSFLANGFREEQILRVFYPVDLSLFKPSQNPRPQDRPFTIINTGGLSLRKGTPYLLEAFRLIHKAIPNARFLLTESVTDSIKPILSKYNDLPIEWSPHLPQKLLAERLLTADLFILPSLEEGLVRTALQAMACGLPVILTPNTGANDYVLPGVNGTIVPICDSVEIANAAEEWWHKIRAGYQVPIDNIVEKLSIQKLDETLVNALSRIP